MTPALRIICICAASIIFLLAADIISGRVLYDDPPDDGNTVPKATDDPIPNFMIDAHKINNLLLAVTNGGTFGAGQPNSWVDPETGAGGPSCEYPAGSKSNYLYIAAFWAGAIVGRDTLVTVGFDGNRFLREFWPDPGTEGAMIRRSSIRTSFDYHPDAVSEQDFICKYTDTLLTPGDPIDNRAHIPLGLEVQQRSYGWSYDYADDFIIFDYTIRNMNRFPLKEIYLGLYVDADIYHQSGTSQGWIDDICGYLHDIPSPEYPGFRDTVRIAWSADNDGDPNVSYQFDYSSPTALTGTAVLRTPNPDLRYSYNWWIANSNASLDWGPRKAGTEERPFRDFGYGLGSPEGDRNKYYIMSSGEFDYDQLESAVSHTDEGWLPPPRNAHLFADGFDARYLFSFGPFDLQPGDTLPITLAYVAGAGFHVAGSDFRDYWDPLLPYYYQQRLDVTQLGENAKWAKWIFDNPGYDTPTDEFPEGDGDSGKVRWVVDSVAMDSISYFYEGDGVPDFRAAAPPPPPNIKVTPGFGTLTVRWNGQISEQNVDVFSGLQDFEGYRVYYAEDNRLTDYVLLASYDIENYNVYRFDADQGRWIISGTPIDIDSLMHLFGPEFDPLPYDRPERSLFSGDDAYYFVPQDWNQSDLTDPRGIRRLYPEADPHDPFDTTEEGHHRYYEYEYVIEKIQPSKPYYVSVTAFDYGSRKIKLTSLESSPNVNAVMAYALPSSETVERDGLRVGVYPNPYRINGGYARAGYENRDRTKSAERSRSIHFYNLPSVCTIRIFTVAGDLVQQIDHYYPGGGPVSQHERWNLISRNTQAVVTGLYIWHVSSEMGEQTGKLVIMK